MRNHVFEVYVGLNSRGQATYCPFWESHRREIILMLLLVIVDEFVQCIFDEIYLFKWVNVITYCLNEWSYEYTQEKPFLCSLCGTHLDRTSNLMSTWIITLEINHVIVAFCHNRSIYSVYFLFMICHVW